MIGTRTAVTQPLSGRPAHVFGFPEALARIKEGHRLARHGWSGRGMWVALTPGSSFEARFAKPGHAAAFRADELRQAGSRDPADPEAVKLQPHLDMRMADGSMLIGWVPSQADMLAEDWYMLPREVE